MGRAEDLFELILTGGPEAIDGFIIERQSEELFLDFKRSSDNGSGTRLHDRDRDNLAKAISGFANSEGGVIVWGIDCRPNQELGDVATAKTGVQNPKRFKSWLENAVSGLTLPPHPGVRHAAVEIGNDQPGFVATFIPKSHMAPHQCLRPPQYYMRAGSNFEPVPHGVLAGMFGRPPQPEIFHRWGVQPAELAQNGQARFKVGVLLTNLSSAIARDIYLNITVFPPGGNNNIAVSFPDRQNWEGTHAFGCMTQILGKENFRLAPHVLCQPLILEFSLAPPFPNHLSLNLMTGCSGSPVKEFSHRLAPDELEQLYADFLSNRGNKEARRRFVQKIIGAKLDETQSRTQEEN